MSALALKIKDPLCPVILYELIPPNNCKSDVTLTDYAKAAVELIFSANVAVDGFNLPEIHEEEREGNRTYNYLMKADPRSFGQELQKYIHGNTELIINHSPVHQPLAYQKQWLDETITKYNQKNLIIVGGESSKVHYQGPSVNEVMHLINDKYKAKFFCGGITIPTRRKKLGASVDEPERLIKKMQSGVNFFTSQVLFEPLHMQRFLKDYAQACDRAGLEPKRIFFSFAPIASKKDIDFLRWLGVVIPDEVEARLLKADIGIGWRSFKILGEILTDILQFHDTHELNIPIGINIEHITQRNFELTKELLEQLGHLYYLYMKR